MAATRWLLAGLSASVLCPLSALAEEAEVEATFERVVIGTRSEQPFESSTAAVEVIDRREIEASGARDLADLLGRRAGFAVEQTQFGSSVQLHGLDPDHVLVLVDGQRQAGRKGGVIDLSRIPLDSVARVEIVRGPASALYGSDAMGGVIQVITRRAGRPLEAEGELRYGERNLLELSGSAATRGDAGLLRVTGGLRRSDPWSRDASGPGTTGSGHEETHVAVRGELDLGGDAKVDATGTWSLRDTTGVDAAAGGAVFDRLNRLESASLSLRPEVPLGAASRLRFTLEGTWLSDQLLQDQRGSTALDQVEHVRERLYGLGVQADTRFGAHLLVVGSELLVEEMESPRLADGSATRQRVGLYAQDDWQIASDVRVSPGLRLDVEDGGTPQPAPRLAMRWDPASQVVLRASYGWAWRAPSFQELLLRFENPSAGYVVQGNPDLRPETSRGATLGAEWKPARAFGLQVELFRHEVDDLIAVATVREASAGSPRAFGYVNVDRAVSQGGEASITLRPVLGLELRGGYAFTDAYDRDTRDPLEGRSRHRASGSVTWRSFESDSEASLRVTWLGPRPFAATDSTSPGSIEVPGHVQLTAHVRQGLTDQLSLVGGGLNLLDAGNADTLPIAPRTLYAGLHFRY